MTMTIMLRDYKVMKVMVLVMARVVTLSNYRESCERR